MSDATPNRTDALRAAWAARDPRERRLVVLATLVVGLFLLWTVALQPALRTLREAPIRLDALDRQLQAMQQQASEARELRATPPLPRAQALAALRAASERLGAAGRLTEQGDRALVTLDNVSPDQFRAWLADVRGAARARPIEATLTRTDLGLSGSVVLAVGGSRE